MKGIVITDFDTTSAFYTGCSCDRCAVLANHVQDFDLGTDLKTGKRVQTLLFVMHDLDKTVFADECIKPSQWTDVPAPAVLLTEKIKQKDGD